MLHTIRAARILGLAGAALFLQVGSASAAGTLGIVDARPIVCAFGEMDVTPPVIHATSSTYSSNGHMQFVEYQTTVQHWSGTAWQDAGRSEISRGSVTYGGINLLWSIDDRAAISQPGFYRIQYAVNWWNGYVDSLGYKRGVTAIIGTSRFDPAASVYSDGGRPTGTAYCTYIAG